MLALAPTPERVGGNSVRKTLEEALEEADNYTHIIVVAETLDEYVVIGCSPMKRPYALGLLELAKRRAMRVTSGEEDG